MLFARKKNRYSAKVTRIFSDKEMPVKFLIYDYYGRSNRDPIANLMIWNPKRLDESLSKYGLSQADKIEESDKLETEHQTQKTSQ